MKRLLLLSFSLLTLHAGRAQEIVVAKEGFATNPVVAVKQDDTPIVAVKGGKARAAVAKAKLMTRPASTFHDAFFTVKPYKIQAAAEEGQLLITGTVVPDRAIPRSFVAVEVKETDGTTKYVRVAALPDNLSPTKPGAFAIQVAGKNAKKSKLRPDVHFFAGAFEVINSTMTPDAIKKAKETRDAFTLKRTPARDLVPVYAEAPIYPASLRASGEAGSAKVLCHVDREGVVTDAKVQEASAPEFGQAAAEALRGWLFAPAIKDGQFVELDVLIPIEFAPVKK
ncbi:energy transducer TonB [Horticoccus luteus]|uniref:Energy transducer TonB n=1 Tax=Horticoccus luteus TaxID=2862869 RepID=A0A8F9XFX7_9BACT|nr:energy transducer TonB [Horticoccus luteus]QYM78547.1 energy transducer TonB [Horticoccus luteus]